MIKCEDLDSQKAVHNEGERFMIINIPMEESFLAPEGTFKGTCTDVRFLDKQTKKKGLVTHVRFLFDLEPIQEGIQYRVGAEFPKDDAKLFAFLKQWLGYGIGGKSFDLQTVRGKQGIIEVVHIPPKGEHEEAYRWVNSVLPPTDNPSLN
jgi:hypothetical protein